MFRIVLFLVYIITHAWGALDVERSPNTWLLTLDITLYNI